MPSHPTDPTDVAPFPFDVVPGRPEHVRRLQEIEVDAGQVFRSIGLDVIAAADPPPTEVLLAHIAGETLWVAVSPAGALIGYVTVSLVDDEAHIDQVSVVRAAAGHRVGATLIERAFTWAAGRDLGSITLTTFREVPWNGPYYRRLGFHEVRDAECGPELRTILRDEHLAGIAVSPRIAMRRALRPVHQPIRRRVPTSVGEVSLQQSGSGPVALFIHGVLLNGHLWDTTIRALRSERTCIALDLPGHGDTIADPADLSFAAHADVIAELLDVIGADAVDVVGNDSGGAIAQILAVRRPHRIRTLTLTNCDTHDNLFPPAVLPFVDLARGGNIGEVFDAMSADPDVARQFFGTSLQDAAAIPDDVFASFTSPLARHERESRVIERWMTALTPEDLSAFTPALDTLTMPTQMIWGTGDVFFDVSWAHWLREHVPGAKRVVELADGRLFFPLEHGDVLAGLLDEFWAA